MQGKERVSFSYPDNLGEQKLRIATNNILSYLDQNLVWVQKINTNGRSDYFYVSSDIGIHVAVAHYNLIADIVGLREGSARNLESQLQEIVEKVRSLD